MKTIYLSRTIWTEKDDEFLRNFYVQLSHSELAERLSRRIGEIKRRIRKLELKLTPEQKILKKQGAAQKIHQKLERLLSDDQIELLKQNFANKSNKELSALIGKSISTIAHKAQELSLKKSSEYMKKTRSRAAHCIKRRPSTELSDNYILVNVLKIPKSPSNRALYMMDIISHRERLLKQRVHR